METHDSDLCHPQKLHLLNLKLPNDEWTPVYTFLYNEILVHSDTLLTCQVMWSCNWLGTEYLHAVAQTREPWPPDFVEKKYPEMMSRETQASWMRTRTYQTIKEAFTQMDKNNTYWSLDKNGVVIDDIFDYARIPGPYEDSDAWMRKRVAAAIMIQKHTRRKIAQRTANRMREYAKAKKEVSQLLTRRRVVTWCSPWIWAIDVESTHCKGWNGFTFD